MALSAAQQQERELAHRYVRVEEARARAAVPQEPAVTTKAK